MTDIPSSQLGLFSGGEQKTKGAKLSPLAFAMRPSNFKDFFGQEDLFKKYPFLGKIGPDFRPPSLILWGPPGTGKTTLATLLAQQSGLKLYPFNAVLSGVADLRKLIEGMDHGPTPILFIDEIHRFARQAQDALLPYLESGRFILFGATTENPRVTLQGALISRLTLLPFQKLGEKELGKILGRVVQEKQYAIDYDVQELIAALSDGDARRALNTLEMVAKEKRPLTLREVKDLLLDNARDFDRQGNRHYDVISAFIKSMRGSDPDAAVLWLAVMLDGGEDPEFIARRLVIFASEDVGNADPSGLQMAINALLAVKHVGMPEAQIILGQATTYLASTVKSNCAYTAINEAVAYVNENKTLEVPGHLQNLSPEKKKYLYPHSYPGHFVRQEYTKEKIPRFYRPSDQGREKILREIHEQRWGKNT